MSTILGNGSVTFGDSTTLSSGIIPWSSLGGHPTLLSQFTNDLGNYGGFLTSANTVTDSFQDPNNIIWGWHRTSGNWNLTWNGSTIGLQINNCNCNCNC